MKMRIMRIKYIYFFIRKKVFDNFIYNIMQNKFDLYYY